MARMKILMMKIARGGKIMDKKKIAEEIRKDIDRGVYQMFPKLKDRLTFIGNKLFNSIYVINSESQLSKGEIQTLIENDYLKEEDI